jgi:pyruvate ferredoxin oxidoreductase alpha subunit
MAMPIGETPGVRLPVMTCMDGFITSHAVENIELLETGIVRKFVGEYNPENYLLKKENPLAVGPYDISPYYMEHKVQQAEAMKAAKARILEVAAEFEKISGRRYGLFEEYRMEDAELALVLMGSSAGTAKAAVDKLREDGVKAGLVKIRVFRPFPGEELAMALANTRAVAVMDKSEGFSANGGPLFAETRSALYDLKERPYLIDIVYGLGGRDAKTGDFENVFGRLVDIAATGEVGPVYTHMGQRSKEE